MLLAIFFETVLSAKRIQNLDAHSPTTFFTESITLETATWQSISWYKNYYQSHRTFHISVIKV